MFVFDVLFTRKVKRATAPIDMNSYQLLHHPDQLLPATHCLAVGHYLSCKGCILILLFCYVFVILPKPLNILHQFVSFWMVSDLYKPPVRRHNVSIQPVGHGQVVESFHPFHPFRSCQIICTVAELLHQIICTVAEPYWPTGGRRPIKGGWTEGLITVPKQGPTQVAPTGQEVRGTGWRLEV